MKNLKNIFIDRIDLAIFSKPDKISLLLNADHPDHASVCDELLLIRIDGQCFLDYLLVWSRRRFTNLSPDDVEALALDAISSLLMRLSDTSPNDAQHLVNLLQQHISRRTLDGFRKQRRLDKAEVALSSEDGETQIELPDDSENEPEIWMLRQRSAHVMHCILLSLERFLADGPTMQQHFQTLICCMLGLPQPANNASPIDTLSLAHSELVWTELLLPEKQARDDQQTMAECVQSRLGADRMRYDHRNSELRKKVRLFLVRQGAAVRERCEEKRY